MSLTWSATRPTGIGSGSSLDAQFKARTSAGGDGRASLETRNRRAVTFCCQALERGGVDDELEKMKRNILPQVRRPRLIAATPLEPPAAVAHLLRTFASQRFQESPPSALQHSHPLSPPRRAASMTSSRR